jgi:hypothetical protein
MAALPVIKAAFSCILSVVDALRDGGIGFEGIALPLPLVAGADDSAPGRVSLAENIRVNLSFTEAFSAALGSASVGAGMLASLPS